MNDDWIVYVCETLSIFFFFHLLCCAHPYATFGSVTSDYPVHTRTSLTDLEGAEKSKLTIGHRLTISQHFVHTHLLIT